MYNRYIPQPDGSFRRSQVPEAAQTGPYHRPPQNESGRQEPPTPCPPPEPEEPCKETVRKNDPRPVRRGRQQRYTQPQPPRNPPRKQPQHTPQEHTEGNQGGFLRQLLPKDFDTGDLLVMALLLLMAGDCPDDKNNALLTMALYLFM